ncbi:Carboxymuconolactone decarboxylase [Desulfatibacillum aliphaticivorans]|uniref:Carboxymuconolactone decarboxylase n=1 Tax=Desulfatibacillum aliphaticivorans TaxID=218208 RepID=B8FJW4_DESAL|nr:carboxymuconolactone decarboxylase family protein [Desulfatibacillum aliphaticivorans]ACL02392.1 Carboxymuconolactone decarboxylase [Desulfatibacillum aliphaticivorans]
MARIPLLEKDQADPIMQELYERTEKGGFPVLNLFKAVAHSPKMGRDFLRLGTAILTKGDLDPILRELAILRIGYVNKAHYEFTQHVRIGKKVGVSDEQIQAVKDWKNAAIFTEEEKAVLDYTDDVNLNIRASEEKFQKIKDLFGDRIAVELTLTIAYYGAVSRILESLAIELEPGVKRED